jgi:anti-sigma factor RsiW
MDCNETRRLLAADVDGELDLVRHLELEQHLRGCPACAAAAESLRAQRVALRNNLPRFTAPSPLADKIRASLRAEANATVPAATAVSSPAVSTAPKPKAPIIAFPAWRVSALAASVAIALFAGFTWGSSNARRNLLFDEAVADHVRSLEANHLNDVASTDQHTVKPWFAGRLAFSPPVVDLAADGFPLTGGRLEHLARHTAAALVYHRRQHAINLFVWPATDGAIAASASARDGFNVVAWSHGDLNFTAVSEIPAAELAHFTELYRAQTP